MVVGSNPTHSVQLSIGTSENLFLYIWFILILYAFQKMSCIYIKLKDIHKIVIFRLFTNLLRTIIYIHVLYIYLIYIIYIIYIYTPIYIYIYSYIYIYLPRVYLAIWIVWFFSTYDDVISNFLCGSDHLQILPLKSSSQFMFASRK